MLGFVFRGFTQEGKRASKTLSNLPEKAQKKKFLTDTKTTARLALQPNPKMKKHRLQTKTGETKKKWK